MPIPVPKKDEEKQKYLSRTIRFLVREGYAQDQAAHIAYKQWRKRKKKGSK